MFLRSPSPSVIESNIWYFRLSASPTFDRFYYCCPQTVSVHNEMSITSKHKNGRRRENLLAIEILQTNSWISHLPNTNAANPSACVAVSNVGLTNVADRCSKTRWKGTKTMKCFTFWAVSHSLAKIRMVSSGWNVMFGEMLGDFREKRNLPNVWFSLQTLVGSQRKCSFFAIF